MELARQQCNSDFLLLAVGSLKKARDNCYASLPILQLLLGQAEASLGYKGQWSQYLKFEWSSWPPGSNFHYLLVTERCAKDVNALVILIVENMCRDEAGGDFSSYAFGFKTVARRWLLCIKNNTWKKSIEMDSTSDTFESILLKILESFTEFVNTLLYLCCSCRILDKCVWLMHLFE